MATEVNPMIAQAASAYRAGGLSSIGPDQRAALTSPEYQVQLLLALAHEVAGQSLLLRRITKLLLVLTGVATGAGFVNLGPLVAAVFK
jgi:hypothetical protein